MLKKSIFIIATIILCNTTQAAPENSDGPYKTGTIIMTTTTLLTTAYIVNSYIQSQSPQKKSDVSVGSNSGLNIIIADENNLSIMASIITLAAIIAEGLNYVDKQNNPIIKKDK